VQEGGLYRLLVNPVEQVWRNAMMEEGFSNLEGRVIKLIVESWFDSLIAIDGSMEVYQDEIVTKGLS
jgi:hypothetical protein